MRQTIAVRATSLFIIPLLLFDPGIVGALGAALGNFLGGWFMKRLQMTPTKAAMFYSASLFVSITGLIGLMLIPCTQPVIAGTESDDG